MEFCLFQNEGHTFWFGCFDQATIELYSFACLKGNSHQLHMNIRQSCQIFRCLQCTAKIAPIVCWLFDEDQILQIGKAIEFDEK